MILWIKSSGRDYAQYMASNFITFCFIAGKTWQKSGYRVQIEEVIILCFTFPCLLYLN